MQEYSLRRTSTLTIFNIPYLMLHNKFLNMAFALTILIFSDTNKAKSRIAYKKQSFELLCKLNDRLCI